MAENGIESTILFPQPIRPTPQRPGQQPASRGVSGSSFSEILQQKRGGGQISFSKHAEARLHSRGIRLTDEEVGKLSGVVDILAQKGGKESLVMMGDSAFIVSVTNRTVVTALDRETMRGNVVTNIDSAAIL
ncbi:MAG: TIGR02530 family flagellar biosynthesis protein [Desulfuromonadia bacterium]